MTMLKVLYLWAAFVHISMCHPTPGEQETPRILEAHPEAINDLQNRLPFQQSMYALKESVTIIDQTIKEVEDLMKSNSSLPRLTRGEIIELIENITKEQLVEASKVRSEKSVMLVMPHTPETSDDDHVQKLFTKPPITKIIDEDGKHSAKSEVKTTIYKRRRRPILKVAQPSSSTTTEQTSAAETTTAFSSTSIQTDLSLDKPTTYKPLLKKRPVYRPTTSTEISVVKNSESVVQTVLKRRRRPLKPYLHEPVNHQNEKPVDPIVPVSSNEGLNVIASPDLSKQQPFTTSSTSTNAPTVTSQTNRMREHLSKISTARPFSAASETTPSRPLFINLNLPQDLRQTLDELNVPNTIDKFQPVPKFNKLPPLDDKMKDVLQIFGAYSPAPFTTTTEVPDLTMVVDNLTPDMKQLLSSFGLLPEQNSAGSPFKSVQQEPNNPFSVEPVAETDPNSYTQFKPMPQSVAAFTDMEEFLGRFGLGRKESGSNRDEKALAESGPQNSLVEIPKFQIDMIPESLQDAFNNLGLIANQTDDVNAKAVQKVLNKTSSARLKQHIYNPNNMPYTSKEELEKLHQILDVIKQLEKLNKTIELHTNKGAIEYDTKERPPLTLQDSGPNPLNFDEGLEKNEVKRQENTTVTPTSTSTTTTVDPNLKGLEDSFGGLSDASTELVTIPRPTSSPAPDTGLYFLLDWNSFLDIDDQKGRRVNLRLQPKVGDPKKFFAVNVP